MMLVFIAKVILGSKRPQVGVPFWALHPASLGQKDPPQKENGIFFQKLDRSFKKGSRSNEFNVAIKLQIFIGI